MNGQNPVSLLISLAIVAIVLFFRMRRLSQSRPLRLERLWIVPAIYLVVAGLMFAERTPHGIGWIWALLSLAAGAAAGWQRGKAMRIAVDPETHEMSQSASPAAILLLIGLIVVRSVFRATANAEGAAWRLDAALITDCLVAFALGLLAVQRLEMFLRGRRLLEAARSGSII